VRRALVLLMDHELNSSTFAARVAASTGASLSACALAGLSTLSGPLHGAAVHGVLKFLRESVTVGARQAVRARLDEGRGLPGFGHPLYPEGDPRAVALLEAMQGPKELKALCDAARDASGQEANVDFAVAAMALTLNLTEEAPFAIFAVGRAVGWLGHAMEQIQTGSLIRPRARYIGPAPETL
jgi:citrate synthase